MPVYEYACPDCGIFPQFRSMNARNDPARCPQCSGVAARVVSAPHLALMSPWQRQAHSTNERSQHEPRVSSRHTCSSQCGCGQPRSASGKSAGATAGTATLAPSRPIRRRKTPPRPWMLGH